MTGMRTTPEDRGSSLIAPPRLRLACPYCDRDLTAGSCYYATEHPGRMIYRRPGLDTEAIYSEGEPIIWLRCETYRTARLAKRIAWSGEGIPVGFEEQGSRLKDCTVRRVWMKSMGAQNGYDEWWQECSVTDVADCVEFFRVESSRVY